MVCSTRLTNQSSIKNKKILIVCRDNDIVFTGLMNYFTGAIESLEKKGYVIERLYNNEKSNYVFTFLRMIFVDPFRMLMKAKNYDHVIISCDLLTNYILFTAKKAIVVFHHVANKVESTLSYKRPTVVDRLLNAYRIYTHRIAKYAEKVVFVSDFTRLDYVRKFKPKLEKCEVIYNPFDLTIFTRRNKSKKVLFEKFRIPNDENAICLLYVGCEAVRKNFITILKTLALMKDKPIKLIKLGLPRVPQNRIEHERYISEHLLDVYFIDFVSDQDLSAFYNVCDLYLNPSLFEGFGRTPIEAQACGLPVISSDCGALKEVLRNSAYIIKDPLDPEELKEAILRMLSDKTLREFYIKKGFENVKRFSLEKQIQCWEALLSSL